IRDRAFDKAEWKAGHGRREMVTDLVARHLRPGTPKKRLYELLGWPEEISGNDYDFSRRWSYCLHWKKEPSFHDRCTDVIDIFFSPPVQARIKRVYFGPAPVPSGPVVVE